MPRPPQNFNTLSPDALDAAAASFEAQAKLLRELAKLRRKGLSSGEMHNTLNDGMSPDQLQQRGFAIAKARARKTPNDLFLQKVNASRWGSLRNYAEAPDGLDISNGSLSGYKTGKRACPRWVAERAKADLGVPLSYWPAGIE